jgi:hypothetical protein
MKPKALRPLVATCPATNRRAASSFTRKNINVSA